jgi:hypothetical protein
MFAALGASDDETVSRLLAENTRVLSSLQAVGRIADCPSLANMIGSCLPHVVPAVVLKSRDEVVPMLVAVIAKADDERIRDELIGVLFGLSKKPDTAQRGAILSGCAFLARILGPKLTEVAILPQSWDSLLHKAEERRVLVAEFAGVVAPYLSESQRLPICMNILKTLLEDSRAGVRVAAVRSLATLVTYASTWDTAPALLAQLKRVLHDTDDAVCKAVVAEYLPRVADFCASFHKLDLGLVQPLLDEIEGQVSNKLALPDRTALRRLGTSVDAVVALFPYMRRATLAWAPFADKVLQCGLDDRARFVLSAQDDSALFAVMREFLRHETDLEFAASDLKWTFVLYLIERFTPKLVAIFAAVSFEEQRPSFLILLGLLDSFWKMFDTQFTLAVLLKPFRDGLQRANLLPALLAGLYVRGSESELVSFVSSTLVSIGTGANGWSYEEHAG